MANKPKSMLQVRRILQLLSDGYSKRETNRLTGVSRNTIDAYELHFQQTGKSFNDLLQLSDTELAAVVYPKETAKDRDPRRKYLSENQDYYLKELNRKGVTRELLWQEYRQEQPEGYMYSQFCELLSQYLYITSPIPQL
jgi:transposase